MPECPRYFRARYALCCGLLFLVVVLIYYGSFAYRLPWEAASRGKLRAAHKGSKNVVSYYQEDTRFRKNKSQRQKQKEWKTPSTRFQENKAKGQKGKKAFNDGAQFVDRPTFEVRDKLSRDGGNPWKKNQDPSKTFPSLGVKDTMSKSEIRSKTNQRPLPKDQIPGRNDKNSRKAENPWKKNQDPSKTFPSLEVKDTISKSEIRSKTNQRPLPRDQILGQNDKNSRKAENRWNKIQVPFMGSQPLELKNKISEYSGKDNQMSFQKSQPSELRNKLWQNSELAWKKNQVPFRKDQTLGLKEKMSPNSMIPWKKNQTEWQEKKMMGNPGFPLSKGKPLGYKDKTAQKPRKLQVPDDWPGFFVPRSQQQFSLKYSYKYRARDMCKATPDILVMVLTTPPNRLRRQAIRDTWGSVVRTRTWPGPTPQTLPKSFKMVFLLGEKRQPGSDVAEAVRRESERYGDIVQWNGMQDSTFNLTLKVLLGLKWVSEYCSGVSRVIKADDDTFVHVPRLLKAILSKPATNLIWGFPSGSLATVRGDSRYAVSKEAYPFENYPYHVKGGMYVLPGHAVAPMVATAPYLPYNSLEDVHMTGTLARVLGIRHQAFTTKEKLEPRDEVPCIFEWFKQGIFCVHIKSVNFPYRIWNKISDPRLCGKYN